MSEKIYSNIYELSKHIKEGEWYNVYFKDGCKLIIEKPFWNMEKFVSDLRTLTNNRIPVYLHNKYIGVPGIGRRPNMLINTNYKPIIKEILLDIAIDYEIEIINEKKPVEKQLNMLNTIHEEIKNNIKYLEQEES